MLILLALPSTEGAAVYTGCVGGGEAVARHGLGGPWLGRPLRRLTVRALSRHADRLDHAASRPLRVGRSGPAWPPAKRGADERCRTGRRLGERAARRTARGARRLPS